MKSNQCSPPTAYRRTPAPTRAEGRGKQRAETKKSSAFELLSLLKEMKSEMKERDEQIRDKLKWRDKHLEDQIRKRENALAVALQ